MAIINNNDKLTKKFIEYIEHNKVVKIKVKPKANSNKIKDYRDGIWLIDISDPPEQSKANVGLIKFLAKLTSKKPIIKSGHNKRLKIIMFID